MPRDISAEQDRPGPDRDAAGPPGGGGRLEPGALVHVWATWCAPCREEFPVLLRFQEAGQAGRIRLLLVSADPPASHGEVARYLAEAGARFPSYIIDNPDAAFVNALSPNWSGAIPASFFFGPGGWSITARLTTTRTSRRR